MIVTVAVRVKASRARWLHADRDFTSHGPRAALERSRPLSVVGLPASSFDVTAPTFHLEATRRLQAPPRPMGIGSSGSRRTSAVLASAASRFDSASVSMLILVLSQAFLFLFLWSMSRGSSATNLEPVSPQEVRKGHHC